MDVQLQELIDKIKKDGVAAAEADAAKIVAEAEKKAESIIDERVKKGDITVNQGKELNEELKMKIKNNKKVNDTITVENLKNILSELNLVTKNDLESINERLKKLEEKEK